MITVASPIVKSIQHGGAKWKDRAGSAAGVYKDGVQNTQKNWAASAGAAAPAWKAGTAAAAQGGRFEKGVAKAGNETWKNAALTKGPDRYTSGVAFAEPKYVTNAAPFYDAIGRVSLPERGPKGSAANYGRVQPIGAALHQLKLGR
jgi:hypothetical protein